MPLFTKAEVKRFLEFFFRFRYSYGFGPLLTQIISKSVRVRAELVMTWFNKV